MQRLDPVQRRTEGEAPSREVVDWSPDTIHGRVLLLTYPVLSWTGLVAAAALVVWIVFESLASLGPLSRFSMRWLAVGAVLTGTGLAVCTAVVSNRAVVAGPPLGALFTSETPQAILLRIACVLGGTGVFGLQLVIADFVFFTRPIILAFVALSIVPALGLVVFIRYTDVTSPDRTAALFVVFLLGLLLANLAAIVNTTVTGTGLFAAVGDTLGGGVSISLFFLLVVAPVEELTKLLASGLYTYRWERFDAVAAGAVYGAFAGLGFATIENAIFISEGIVAANSNEFAEGQAIAVGRAFAGPGHVIWSGLAGYYLGLARFNDRYAGPLVCKGLLAAIILHGVYNVSLRFAVAPVAQTAGAPLRGIFVIFAVLYHGLAFSFLVYKLLRYRDAHRDASNGAHIESELAEFDP